MEKAKGKAVLKVALIGNCQTEGIARCIEAMDAGIELKTVRPAEIPDFELEAGTDMLLVQDEVSLIVGKHFVDKPAARLKQVRFPAIYFTAFHPDFVYVRDGTSWLTGPLGGGNSAIVVGAWKQGFSIDETLRLFNADVFAELGYFNHWDVSEANLLRSGDELGMDLRGELAEWRRGGCFLYCPNHPKLAPHAGIARQILDKLGIRPKIRYPENYTADLLASNVVWPLYPEIGESFGFSGEYCFRDKYNHKNRSAASYDLEQFVRACFDMWKDRSPEMVSCKRFEDSRLANLSQFRSRPVATRGASHPYKGIPRHQRWNLAVAKPDPSSLDPVVSTKFKISKTDRIATAGSCFAQHIAKGLRSDGYLYYNVENGKGLTKEESSRRNFGVFSARFGNIYTPRQLVQLIDRSEGRIASHPAWQRDDLRFVDPYRPLIEPDGFATADDVDAAREEHFKFVQRMWRKSNVFIFTLGLTEAWVDHEDGTVYPVAPGVNGGAYDPAKHKFRNFTVDETIGDLREFCLKLRAINPYIRIILTVSPVPLVATAENRHALVATTYSKSVLRVAAEEIARSDNLTEYFPSYEIITGAYNRGTYFAEDLRSVTPEGVEHVMRVFMKHYAAEHADRDVRFPVNDDESGAFERASGLLGELRMGQKIVCDEEEIERALQR